MSAALRRLVLAVLCWGLPACGDGSVDVDEIANQAVAEWPSDRSGVARRVAELPDPLARIAATRALSEAYPGQVGVLCAALPDDETRARCVRLDERPHLREPGRAGPVDVVVPVGLCTAAPDPPACLDAAAADATATGDAARADAICSGHGRKKWVDDCRFQAAEAGVKRAGATAYPAAVALCRLAEPFSRNCWAHLLVWLPREVPPPDGGPDAAAVASSLAATVRGTWSASDSAMAELQTQRFWSIWFAVSYLSSRSPDGSPLAWYPPETWPHVRAGLALRLVDQGALHGSLADRQAALQAALDHRTPPASRAGTRPDLLTVNPLMRPPPAEPTTAYLGSARRPVSDDVAEDLTFCLLAAAARTDPPDRALLEEAASVPNARVSEEARRLLSVIPSGQSGR